MPFHVVCFYRCSCLGVFLYVFLKRKGGEGRGGEGREGDCNAKASL